MHIADYIQENDTQKHFFLDRELIVNYQELRFFFFWKFCHLRGSKTENKRRKIE